ncbi:MAG: DUF1553 domain-containing protein, partial [Planctomycetota bacterium]|nr:DUF1553 domain-containing protein [Planctomycetota bacterium]
IEALNRDKPYDLFVREQLAGDALGSNRATGYLVAGPNDLVKSRDENFIKLQRQDELADMINTTGTTFLGLTLGCARCHSHKFDPITQKDYYSLQAVFAGVNHAERPLPVTEVQQEQRVALGKRMAVLESALEEYRITPVLRPAVSSEWNQEQFQPTEARFVRFTVLRTSSGEPCIDELSVFSGTKNVGLASEGVTATASSEYPKNHRHKIVHINDGRVGNEYSWISAQKNGGWIQLQFPEVTRIDRIEWARDRERKYRDRLPVEYRIEVAVEAGKWTTVATHEDRTAYGTTAEETPRYDFSELPDAGRLEAKKMEVELRSSRQRLELLAKPQMVYGGTFSTPPAVYRLFRGDASAPRERVAPDAIEALGSLELAMDTPEQHRRLRLADWMVAPENPLTARVIVNRIWQHCFGIGIVDTPSDFGTAGSEPTHPELLDYLASELRDHQWSLKHIHRLILESSTFRQSSVPVKAALEQDADTRYLWRFPPRRLEAEAIRDSILAVSGALDLRRGGPGFSGFQVEMENVRHYFPLEEFGPPQWRRMIYQTKVRQEQDAVFGVFDCPDASQVVAKRSRSTTPLQALNLLNSRFVMQQAEILSARLEVESPKSAAGQVRRAFHLAYTRRPALAEVTAGKALIDRFGLPAFCRALLNSNEFLFIQ